MAATDRLIELMREEAEKAGASDTGRFLEHLAETTDKMTPAEKTWVGEASEQELRGFVRALRLGCPPDDAA
jgi:hypothetical protein